MCVGVKNIFKHLIMAQYSDCFYDFNTLLSNVCFPAQADIQFFIYLPKIDSEKFQIRIPPAIEITPSKIHPFLPSLIIS